MLFFPQIKTLMTSLSWPINGHFSQYFHGACIYCMPSVPANVAFSQAHCFSSHLRCELCSYYHRKQRLFQHRLCIVAHMKVMRIRHTLNCASVSLVVRFSKRANVAHTAAMLHAFRSSVDWAVPKQTKLKYNQVFNSNDRSKTGYLSSIFLIL